MTLQEYLMDEYGYNEPIFSSEIKYNDYSTGWITNEFERMVSNGTIKRFDDEVYYFSQKMFFGDSLLDTRKVIKKRYISDENDVYGYIAGLSLLNFVGVSTQVPNLTEVVTNRQKLSERYIYVGKQRVLIKSSDYSITKDNVNALQFLELMSLVSLNELEDDGQFMLKRYVKYLGVRFNELRQYLHKFPDNVVKNITESGVLGEVT